MKVIISAKLHITTLLLHGISSLLQGSGILAKIIQRRSWWPDIFSVDQLGKESVLISHCAELRLHQCEVDI